jgi:hypothetical protein
MGVATVPRPGGVSEGAPGARRWYHRQMPSCALCENVQPDGDGCDVCGRPFPARQRNEVAVEPLEDMEATLLPSTGNGGEALAFEDLESTGVDPVMIVADAMEGLETTSVEGTPGGGPSTESIIAICRYCRTPGFPGEAFCAHCGMRLPAVAGPQATALEVRLCRDCGTPVQGEACPACGVRPSR